ncbi:hypothetical protein INT43_006106 [Umbelopsis isabellina]|uniref:Programmed cell death protein 7 n=1 Tax=Mortierella isabellina TaxID=91625 RepID=A0A8H7UD18_MORIS|nr:hypothetical protein INT43_006106 [Umbelopsis isabellina]
MYPHFHNTGQATMPRDPKTHAHVGNLRHHVAVPVLETTPSTRVDKSETTSELHRAKTRLAEAILQHEQFNDILENAIASPDSLTDANMADLNNKKASALCVQLQNMLRELNEKSKLEQLKEKRARQKRKREWKRRHIKILQDTRNRRRERRLKIHQDIDRWRLEWIEKDAADKQKEKERQEADKQRKLAASARNRERNNQLLVDKLLELRTIRRNKLKAQGHFFPEEGNEFYEHIRKLNQMGQESIKQDEPAEEEVIALKPHEDDQWLHNDLDFDTYKYWCQGNSSLESLRKVRRQWDYYLTDTNKTNDMKVPLTMVQPAPPSNWIWATVLV